MIATIINVGLGVGLHYLPICKNPLISGIMEFIEDGGLG
mgnify:CR=1 FL=1|tara:strand:+ start:12983 stop:13099 length:117 start_codon:yes stop_codon:yes gene_type:complete